MPTLHLCLHPIAVRNQEPALGPDDVALLGEQAQLIDAQQATIALRGSPCDQQPSRMHQR